MLVPTDYVQPLDPGIAHAVAVLRAAGLETFKCCGATPDHARSERTVCFYGSRDDGYRALAAALQGGVRVSVLRKSWQIVDDEPTGPHWEMVFANDPSDVN